MGKALDQHAKSDKAMDRAVNVATNHLKGLGVYVSKSEQMSTEHKSVIEEKRLKVILENKLTEQLRLDRDVIDVDAVVVDEPDPPPVGGTPPEAGDDN